MMRETMKTARIRRKIFVFKMLWTNLLQNFLHVPVMGPCPVDVPAGAALQELIIGMKDIDRDPLPDVFISGHLLKLTVAACAAPPARQVKAAEAFLHLCKLLQNMIRGDEYAVPDRFVPQKTGITGDDRPSLFLGDPDDLPVIHKPIIKHIMAHQPQPCCEPPEHDISDKFHCSIPAIGM
jgi:hypothetical protein